MARFSAPTAVCKFGSNELKGAEWLHSVARYPWDAGQSTKHKHKRGFNLQCPLCPFDFVRDLFIRNWFHFRFRSAAGLHIPWIVAAIVCNLSPFLQDGGKWICSQESSSTFPAFPLFVHHGTLPKGCSCSCPYVAWGSCLPCSSVSGSAPSRGASLSSTKWLIHSANPPYRPESTI